MLMMKVASLSSGDDYMPREREREREREMNVYAGDYCGADIGGVVVEVTDVWEAGVPFVFGVEFDCESVR